MFLKVSCLKATGIEVGVARFAEENRNLKLPENDIWQLVTGNDVAPLCNWLSIILRCAAPTIYLLICFYRYFGYSVPFHIVLYHK